MSVPVQFASIDNDPLEPWRGPERRKATREESQAFAEASALKFLLISIFIFFVGIALGYCAAVQG